MPFIESDLENLIIDQIKNKNYEYVYGENLDRNYEDIIVPQNIKSIILTNRIESYNFRQFSFNTSFHPNK